MRRWFIAMLAWGLAGLSAAQESQLQDRAKPRSPGYFDFTKARSASEFLERAGQDANHLEGAMRAWALWQVARVYQSMDKKKSLNLLETALAETELMKDEPVSKMQEALLQGINGEPPLSAKTWLGREIVLSIVATDPSRADDILQRSDPANRGPILEALLSYYERNKQSDHAIEQFYRITAVQEAPYAAGRRIIASLGPEQSSEIAGVFGACLSSYQEHAGKHSFFSADEFPRLVALYWRLVPRPLARDAVDAILQQAEQESHNSSQTESFAMVFNESGRAAGSVLEYRLAQLLPALQELESSRANEYLEKFAQLPVLAKDYSSSVSSATATAGEEPASRSFNINGDSGNLFLNMAEQPSAQKIAAEADAGHGTDAISHAAKVSNPDLRAQIFEYIARTTVKKEPATAVSALQKLLPVVETLKLDRQPAYYRSAASLFFLGGDVSAARKAIEKGLDTAAELYRQDTDSDDPNTAMKAFWPSTHAYCILFRQAQQISQPWALQLLREIDDPQIRVAAEIAMTSGIMNISESRATVITAKRKGFRVSLGPSSPAEK